MAVGGSTIAYMIGNSLTMDSNPESGLAMLAADFGRYLFPQYHTQGGTSLKGIQTSNTPELSQGGPWNPALAVRVRDFLTCQPFYAVGSTLGLDIEAITAFNDLFFSASPSAKSCIYSTIPRVVNLQEEYQPIWTGAVVNNPSTATVLQRQYFDHLYTAMNALYPGKMLLIPIGEVFNNIDIAARAGQFPGIDEMNHMYRDSPGVHMGTAGRFVVASTVIACLFRRKTQASPATVAFYQSLGGSTVMLTDAMAALIETIVWDTVRADSRTGVAG